MIDARTLAFLSQIAVNNNKEWMDAHRQEYMDAKQDFEKFVTALLPRMEVLGIDAENTNPKSCIFRMNRDVRFSNNKEPYKNNFGASISIGGKKSPMAGYYVHLQPGHSFIGAGMWMPDAEVLRKVRQEIDYNLDAFTAIVEDKLFVKTVGSISGERLKSAPKGYEKDNPAVEYLKFKSFTIGKSLSDEAMLDAHLLDEIMKDYGRMSPFVDFLNRALD